MESIFDYLDRLEDIIENTKPLPFSNKVSIDKERIYDIISDMRMNMPTEILQAQKITQDHFKIIDEAKEKASAYIREASLQAKDLVDEQEVYKNAVDEADELLEEAKQSAREMRLGSLDYAEEVMAKTEKAVRDALTDLDEHYRRVQEYFVETINELYETRQALRGNKS